MNGMTRAMRADSAAPKWRPAVRTSVAVAATCALLLGALSAVPTAAAAPSDVEDWQGEVLGTGESTLRPEVVAASAGVTNPGALASGGTGAATFTWDGTGTAPYVILDYGPIVGGLPYFVADSSTGDPSVRTAYSESRKYINRVNESELVKSAPAGSQTVYVTNTTQMTVGQSLVIGSGADQETVSIVTVGQAAVSTTAFAPIAAGSTNVEVPSVTNFAVGAELLIGTGETQESVTITAVGRTSTQTSLASPAAAGDAVIRVASVAGRQVGDVLVVGGESVTVTSVGTAGAAGTGLTLSAPLAEAHAASSVVVFHGTGLSFAPATTRGFDVSTVIRTPRTGVAVSPLQKAHASGSAVRSTPGNLVGDNAGYLGTGVGSPRNRVTQVTAAGTYTTPANALQGGIRFEAVTLTTPGTVTISEVGVVSKFPNYGPEDYAGWFDSSDEVLNDIWYSGAYTVDTNMVPIGAQNNSTRPVILDGAKRDRRIWAGDLFNAGRSTYTAFGYGAKGSDYISNSIDVLGSRQAADGSVPGESANWNGTPATTAQFYSTAYSIYFPVGLVDYYRYSGDLAFAGSQYSRLKAQMNYNLSLTNEDGLIVTTSGSDGRDWDFYDGGRAGTVTATNVLYYRALTEAAWLAGHLISNNPSDANAEDWAADKAAWEEQAGVVKASINATLFDENRGAYIMSNVDTGTHSGNAIPQDANSMAVLWGVAPKDKVTGILETLENTLWGDQGPQPFSPEANNSTLISTHVTGFELAARFEAGDTDAALELTKNLWARMANPADPFYTGAFWENHQQNGDLTDANKSLAHAWATGPTWNMSAYLLGVKPVEPGFATFSVTPHLSDLEWSKGTVPTPHGPIGVSWTQSSDDVVVLDVDVPSGTRGEVKVPLAEGAVSGASEGAEFIENSEGYAIYSVAEPGAYTFVSAPVSATLTPAAPAESGWYTEPVTVNLSAIAADSGASVQYQLDGGDWTTYNGPFEISVQGEHDLAYRATTLGASTATTTVSFKIDSVAPVSSATVDETEREVAVRSADATSGVDRIEVKIAEGEWQVYDGPVEVGDARTIVQFRAIDVAGNVEPAGSVVVPKSGVELKDSLTAALISDSSVRYYDSNSVAVRVTGSGGTPTGAITIVSDDVVVGRGTLVSGRATISLNRSLLTPGAYPLAVNYSGDQAFAASTDTVGVKVAKATAAVKASFVDRTIKKSQTPKLKVSVGSRAPVTGSVTVKEGSRTLKASVSLVNGKATINLPKLKKGTHKVVVTFNGSSTIATARSASISITVR